MCCAFLKFLPSPWHQKETMKRMDGDGLGKIHHCPEWPSMQISPETCRVDDFGDAMPAMIVNAVAAVSRDYFHCD